jgi:predicted RNase H-like HicB family nuclease
LERTGAGVELFAADEPRNDHPLRNQIEFVNIALEVVLGQPVDRVVVNVRLKRKRAEDDHHQCELPNGVVLGRKLIGDVVVRLLATPKLGLQRVMLSLQFVNTAPVLGGQPEVIWVVSPRDLERFLGHEDLNRPVSHINVAAHPRRPLTTDSTGPPPAAAVGVQPLVGQPNRVYISRVTFTIELEREDDGRWLAEVPALAGVLCYGKDRDDAVARVQALALRVIAERLEHGEAPAEFLDVRFQAA